MAYDIDSLEKRVRLDELMILMSMVCQECEYDYEAELVDGQWMHNRPDPDDEDNQIQSYCDAQAIRRRYDRIEQWTTEEDEEAVASATPPPEPWILPPGFFAVSNPSQQGVLTNIGIPDNADVLTIPDNISLDFEAPSMVGSSTF
jgi:hypothetical protein